MSSPIVPVNYRGPWSITTQYSVNDCVLQSSTYYLASQANIGVQPPGVGWVAVSVSTYGMAVQAWPVFNVKDYGATATGGVASDGVISAGSNVLTSALGAFNSSMVGQPIYVLGAGTGTSLLSTTVIGFTNSGQITLAVNASTAVTGAGKNVTWGTDDTATIQAAIDAAYNAGGGEVYIPAGRYLVSYTGPTPIFNHPSALRLRQFVRLRGAGKWTSILTLAPNSNCAVVSNAQADAYYDATLNSGNGAYATPPTHGNAEFISLCDLGIDANKSGGMVKGPTAVPTGSVTTGTPAVDQGTHRYAWSYQTSTSESPIGPISGTVNVTASGKQVTVGGFSSLPTGGSRVGTGVNLYRTVANSLTPLLLVHQFTWADVDTILAGSGTWVDSLADSTLSVVARRGDGVLLGMNPYAPAHPNGVDTEYDPHQYLSNVYVRNAMNTGFYTYGLSAMELYSCHAYSCDQYGFRPTADAALIGCHAGVSGLQGYWVETSAVRLIGCKAFFAGNVDNTNGGGFRLNGTFGVNISGCEAQDNQGPGFDLNLTVNCQISGTCDSNSKRGNGFYPAVEIFNSSHNHINARCFDRNSSFTQSSAVRIRESADSATNISVGNVINADNLYEAGDWTATILSPSVMNDSKTGITGNKVTIGTQDAIHNAGSISGTFTPDIYANGGHVYGTVTGALTLAAPAHPTSSSQHWGVELEFVLTANSGGPYVVTWDSIYLLNSADTNLTSITASKTLRVTLAWNGTKWAQKATSILF